MLCAPAGPYTEGLLFIIYARADYERSPLARTPSLREYCRQMKEILAAHTGGKHPAVNAERHFRRGADAVLHHAAGNVWSGIRKIRIRTWHNMSGT